MFSILFADDTNSLASGSNLEQLVSTVNEELKKVVIWLASNKLSLNIKKTHFMLFLCKGKYQSSPVSIKISNEEIKKVDHTKFLGVIIDEKLIWSHHLNCIKRKAAKGVGVMCKAKKFLNEKTLMTLYYSLVYPYLQYGIIAWGTTYQTHLDPLIKIQKRVIRIISSAPYLAHTEPLFNKLKLLNLRKIYILNVMMFMFRFHHAGLPAVFNNLFSLNTEIHRHFTRQANKLHSPHWRLE